MRRPSGRLIFPIQCSSLTCWGKAKRALLYRKLVVEQKLAQAVEAEVDPQQLGSVMSLATAQQGVTTEQLTRCGLKKSWRRLSVLRQRQRKSRGPQPSADGACA